MLFTLDNRTQAFVQVVVSLALLGIMLIAWRTQKTYPGWGRWTVSKAVTALGFLLVSLRGLVSDDLSIPIANVILLIPPIWVYEGVRQFRGKPHRSYLHYGLFVLLLAASFYFQNVYPSPNARLAVLGVCLTVILFRTAWNLLINVPSALRASYWFTGALFALYGIVIALRFATLGSLTYASDDFLTDPFQSVALLATIVMPIGWTFGFFMMTNDRLTLELRTAESGLRQMVATDFLTGVMNRRAFVEYCESHVARTPRDTSALALLIIDIDYFKKFNDTYGHLAGDELLRAMVATCRANLRAVDLLARWGGEEFAVLLPNTEYDDCALTAERLRHAVATLTIPVGDDKVSATISIGGALWTLDDADLDSVLRRADVALYQAKERGRDCVVIQDGSTNDATQTVAAKNGAATESVATNLRQVRATNRDAQSFFELESLTAPEDGKLLH